MAVMDTCDVLGFTVQRGAVCDLWTGRNTEWETILNSNAPSETTGDKSGEEGGVGDSSCDTEPPIKDYFEIRGENPCDVCAFRELITDRAFPCNRCVNNAKVGA